MQLRNIIIEADLATKIVKDPKLAKMLALVWKHDGTVPPNLIAKLGPKPSDQDIAKTFGELIDTALATSAFGDLSSDGKFDEWLMRLYVSGNNDYEDITGEGIDSLGKWKALSKRNFLKPQHQDFNQFKNIRQIQTVLQDRDYINKLRRIKDEATIEKHKREKSDTVLIDDDRFFVMIPFNYGACYTFNNAYGVTANFCTGSSSGLQWFQNYSPQGPIVSIFDKNNPEDKNGKWQFHAPTNQLVNANQDLRWDLNANDKAFAKLFPGLMERIVQAMLDKREEINSKSQALSADGYDVQADVELIKNKFPVSYASEEPSQSKDQQIVEHNAYVNKLLREYASRIAQLKEYAWWPAKKAAVKPATGGATALVGKAAMPTTLPAQRPKTSGDSYPINTLLKIANQLKTGQGQNMLDTVDTLVSGLTNSLSQFQAEPAVKQNFATLLRNIAQASDSGDEKTVAAEIEKLHSAFHNLMKTGQYDL